YLHCTNYTFNVCMISCAKRMRWPACSPDLNLTEHWWDQHAVHARVTNTTTLADLREMLVEEWDAIPQQCVTKLVTSIRRRQAVVPCVCFFHMLLQPLFVK
uniref:Tc1-like transposase DDE domain-containing protein n=1 Tax=Amphilophus citrinellus TaxID=61819 RepID=A0A3Q0STJ6_AMPCI